MDVHVVFGETGAGALREALRQFKSSHKWKVFFVPDLFSVGPVWQLQDEVGIRNRFDWIKKHLLREKPCSYFSEDNYESSFRSSVQQLKEIDKQTLITIWTAENAHDQTGLRYVCRLFQGKDNELQVINASKAFQKHFSRDYPIHYVPFQLGEINPDQLKVMLDDSQLLQTIFDDD